MRVRASIFFRSSFAAKRHGVLLGLSLLLLKPDAALSEIVFSGDRNIAIPTNFDGVYINIGNGQFGSSPVSGWDLNPFFGGLFIANSPNFQPARIGDYCEDAIIRLAPTSVIGGNLTYSSDWGGSGAEGGQGHLGSGPCSLPTASPGISASSSSRRRPIRSMDGCRWCLPRMARMAAYKVGPMKTVAGASLPAPPGRVASGW